MPNQAIETGLSVTGAQNGTHYRLNHSYNGHRYVVASCAHLPGLLKETLIFPANQYGEVMCYDELAGTRSIDVAEAFRQLGDYEIVPYVPPAPKLMMTTIMLGNIPLLQWRWLKNKR